MASAGTISASSARLGIVWITPATPSTSCAADLRRVIQIPSGTLMQVPISSATRESCRWAVK